MLGLGDQAFPQLLTLNSDIQEGTKLESYHGEALLNKSLELQYCKYMRMQWQMMTINPIPFKNGWRREESLRGK